jgi:hypothetical protein
LNPWLVLISIAPLLNPIAAVIPNPPLRISHLQSLHGDHGHWAFILWVALWKLLNLSELHFVRWENFNKKKGIA